MLLINYKVVKLSNMATRDHKKYFNDYKWVSLRKFLLTWRRTTELTTSERWGCWRFTYWQRQGYPGNQTLDGPLQLQRDVWWAHHSLCGHIIRNNLTFFGCHISRYKLGGFFLLNKNSSCPAFCDSDSLNIWEDLKKNPAIYWAA